MIITCPLTDFKPPSDRFASPFLGSSPFPKPHRLASNRVGRDAKSWNNQGRLIHRRGRIVCGWQFPIDPWAPNIDSQSIATQLFAASLFPYIGFLYFITKSKSAPKLTLFGFYFLLVFVGATSKFFPVSWCLFVGGLV